MRLQADEQKEQKVLEMVLKTAPSGDPQAVIDAIDNYAWSTGFLMNIGDRKGAIMEAALHECQPKVCCNIMNERLDRWLSYLLLPPVKLLVVSACACMPTSEHKHVKSCTTTLKAFEGLQSCLRLLLRSLASNIK